MLLAPVQRLEAWSDQRTCQGRVSCSRDRCADSEHGLKCLVRIMVKSTQSFSRLAG